MTSSEPWDFKCAAAAQRRCAVTGDTTDDWEAHHVVEKAELKRLHVGDRYDTRNALRLRTDIHRNGDIPMSALTNDNFRYAFEALGIRAITYLQTHYRGSDPRFEVLRDEWESKRVS